MRDSPVLGSAAGVLTTVISPKGQLARVKKPDGEIRLSEFSPGTKGGFSVGAENPPVSF